MLSYRILITFTARICLWFTSVQAQKTAIYKVSPFHIEGSGNLRLANRRLAKLPLNLPVWFMYVKILVSSPIGTENSLPNALPSSVPINFDF